MGTISSHLSHSSGELTDPKYKTDMTAKQVVLHRLAVDGEDSTLGLTDVP